MSAFRRDTGLVCDRSWNFCTEKIMALGLSKEPVSRLKALGCLCTPFPTASLPSLRKPRKPGAPLRRGLTCVAPEGAREAWGFYRNQRTGMDFDLVQIRQQAERKEEENHRFRLFLKRKCNLEPDEIDSRVYAATRRAWAGIDCTQCANCCR